MPFVGLCSVRFLIKSNQKTAVQMGVADPGSVRLASAVDGGFPVSHSPADTQTSDRARSVNTTGPTHPLTPHFEEEEDDTACAQS